MSSSINTPRTPDDQPDPTGTDQGPTRSDTAPSDTARPDTARSDTPRSGTTRSDTARSDTARSDATRSGTAASDTTASDTTASDTTRPATARDLVRQQKDQFGGMKFGACFFGWLTATGTAVLLTGLLTAIGLGVGRQQDLTPAQATGSAGSLGLVGAIVLLVVILVAYYCGGYVAGRMARFNGFKQGVGVWLWSIIAAVIVTVLGLVAGDRFTALSSVNSLPSLPVSRDALTTGAMISVVVVIVAALVGAILGGLVGMRYHRRIDRASFTD